MAQSIPFGARSTADQVLAGIDLTRKRMVVTGCHRGVGLEIMKALVANGAHVIGLARTLDEARAACDEAGTSSTPVACNLADFDSIDSAVDSIREIVGPLDAVITNTERAGSSVPTRRCGIEPEFTVDYLGHFALIDRLTDRVRGNGGRIVVAGGDAAATSANAIYAKELSRRLAPRGVSVNSWDSGSTGCAGLDGQRGWMRRLFHPVARVFMKSAAQRAATAALLAASPLAAGMSGAYWSNCRIVDGNPLQADEILGKRFWETSEQIVSAIRATRQIAPAQAGNGPVYMAGSRMTPPTSYCSTERAIHPTARPNVNSESLLSMPRRRAR
jgi:WW domain-containing oxidoreductase